MLLLKHHSAGQSPLKGADKIERKEIDANNAKTNKIRTKNPNNQKLCVFEIN